MINPVTCNSNVSFNGIVKVKRVLCNGEVTNDPKIIDSALRKFRRVLLKQADTPENTEKLSIIRKMYNLLDPDYTIPETKVMGNSRSFLTRIRNRMNYFIASGNDAERLNIAGKDIGRTNKFVEMDFGTRKGYISESSNQAARQSYRNTKDEIAERYSLKKEQPAIVLKTVSGKKGKIDLLSISFEPKISIKVPETPQNSPKPKAVQTDFMKILFPNK